MKNDGDLCLTVSTIAWVEWVESMNEGWVIKII